MTQKRQPIIRSSIKTRSSYEAMPDTFVNFATFWRNEDNGYISGQFSDGWRPEGKEGFRIISINTKDQKINPATCYLNATIEDGSGRSWIKDKSTGDTVSLFKFDTKLVGEAVRFENASFYKGIQSVTFERISPEGATQELTVGVEDVFVNGVVKDTDLVATSSRYSDETVLDSNIPF